MKWWNWLQCWVTYVTHIRLIGQSKGTAMRLPKEALQRAFELYPPLRMRLLEELAREVSRAYGMCCVAKLAGLGVDPRTQRRRNLNHIE